MPQEGRAVWEGAAAGETAAWLGGGPGLPPSWAHREAILPGDQAAGQRAQRHHCPGSATDQVPPRDPLHTGLPAPLCAGARAASSGPLCAHGKHLAWSLCNPVLARRLTVSSTNCPGV